MHQGLEVTRTCAHSRSLSGRQIQGSNSLPLVLLFWHGKIKLRGIARRWSRPFPGLEQGDRGQVGQDKPRKKWEENEDLLRNLSEIWFPSVTPNNKLFYPFSVTFNIILAWVNKIRKSKWQQEPFFAANTLKLCLVCQSGIMYLTGTSLYGIKVQLCDISMWENKQTKPTKTIKQNTTIKSLLVKFCFELKYRKSILLIYLHN